MASKFVRTIAAGAGFAGDRIEPAVALAGSGEVDAVVLECLAERTLVPALRARQVNADAGYDPRLRRRLAPLLPAAKVNACRVISNLGAANPAAAGRAVALLAEEIGLSGLRIAAVTGDDVLVQRDQIVWQEPLNGELLGAHAYLGFDALAPAIAGGADVVVTGRVADAALFAAEVVPHLEQNQDALANAIAVGHLLECAGQLTGGNFEAAGGDGLDAQSLADLGYPMARIAVDGNAEIVLLDGAPGRLDVTTCILQLLYEVHDPSRYITPDAVIDFSGIRFTEVGRNRVQMRGARAVGRPETLKVSGFIDRPGAIADVEIGFAGRGAYARARRAADTLRLRLRSWPSNDLAIDIVGADSILRAASPPTNAAPAEARVHVSARCPDLDMAQAIEDEVYSLTLAGPAGGASIRSERRPRLEVVMGLIPRELVRPEVTWTSVP